MLLSKQEGANKKLKRGGGKKRNKFWSTSKGAILFPNVKIMVFLFSAFGYL